MLTIEPRVGFLRRCTLCTKRGAVILGYLQRSVKNEFNLSRIGYDHTTFFPLEPSQYRDSLAALGLDPGDCDDGDSQWESAG